MSRVYAWESKGNPWAFHTAFSHSVPQAAFLTTPFHIVVSQCPGAILVCMMPVAVHKGVYPWFTQHFLEGSLTETFAFTIQWLFLCGKLSTCTSFVNHLCLQGHKWQWKNHSEVLDRAHSAQDKKAVGALVSWEHLQRCTLMFKARRIQHCLLNWNTLVIE